MMCRVLTNRQDGLLLSLNKSEEVALQLVIFPRASLEVSVCTYVHSKLHSKLHGLTHVVL